jgi:hypothetical protein
MLLDMGSITQEKYDEIIQDLNEGVVSSRPHIKRENIINRPLRFRVFDIQEKELDHIGDLYWFEENHITQSEDCCRYIIDEWTGMIDKNDKEIYENDLINFTIKECEVNRVNSYKNQLVMYDTELAMFVFGKDKFCMADKIYKDTIEIVGNIHEYKERE